MTEGLRKVRVASDDIGTDPIRGHYLTMGPHKGGRGLCSEFLYT